VVNTKSERCHAAPAVDAELRGAQQPFAMADALRHDAGRRRHADRRSIVTDRSESLGITVPARSLASAVITARHSKPYDATTPIRGLGVPRETTRCNRRHFLATLSTGAAVRWGPPGEALPQPVWVRTLYDGLFEGVLQSAGVPQR
jgi:hypothetical protein